jgi:hypothetical protein
LVACGDGHSPFERCSLSKGSFRRVALRATHPGLVVGSNPTPGSDRLPRNEQPPLVVCVTSGRMTRERAGGRGTQGAVDRDSRIVHHELARI